jgi:hypothetical protein
VVIIADGFGERKPMAGLCGKFEQKSGKVADDGTAASATRSFSEFQNYCIRGLMLNLVNPRSNFISQTSPKDRISISSSYYYYYSESELCGCTVSFLE